MSRDGAIIEGLVRAISGVCRYCRCSGDSCTTPDGDRCVWMGNVQPPRTLCSAEACQAAYRMDKLKEKEALRKARKFRTKGRRAA